MKRRIAAIAAALSLTCALPALAIPPGALTNTAPQGRPVPNVSVSEAARTAAQTLLKHPISLATPVASLNWYHINEQTIYMLSVSKPMIVTYDLTHNAPVARLDSTGYFEIDVRKYDPPARSYFVDCIADGKPTTVNWFTRDSLDPSKETASGTSSYVVINGVNHLQFVLDKPQGAGSVYVIVKPTAQQIDLYSCDIYSVS